MTIKTDNSNLLLVIILYILCLSMVILMLIIGGLIPAIFLFITTTIILTSYFVSICRIITMTDSGCRVVFWKFAKEYTWDAIFVKRLEPPHLGLRLAYHDGGAFFSIRPTRKPVWLDPTLYCTFRHPYSCFYVYFSPNSNKKKQDKTPGIYEVDKDLFLRQLEAWGVKLV